MNKLRNLIRHTEKLGPVYEVSTLTEDGHRISGFGITTRQAIYDAHKKAKVYGDYRYPSYS